MRVSYGGGEGLARTAPYRVRHAKGETRLTIDQSQKPTLQGLWYPLGRFTFGASGADPKNEPAVAEVSLSNKDAGGWVIADAVQFVKEAGANVAATITAHHLLYNRTHMLGHGMKPMLFCLPILKRDVHQQALIAAATSGDPSFFLGTDSAPHPQDAKENICGCAALLHSPRGH